MGLQAKLLYKTHQIGSEATPYMDRSDSIYFIHPYGPHRALEGPRGLFAVRSDNLIIWKHEWEKPFLEASEDFIFRNTFGDVRKIVKILGDECGTKFEHECYDIGHLYNLAHFVDAGATTILFCEGM